MFQCNTCAVGASVGQISRYRKGRDAGDGAREEERRRPRLAAGLLDKLVRAHQSGMVSPIALSLTVSANLHEQLLHLGAAQRK
jgi:hypothetical protein